MNKKILLLTFGALFSLLLAGCWITAENGRHSGQITAVEKHGIFFKTWDVYIKSDISSSQEEMYCVENDALIPLLQNAAEDKTRVTLQYHDEFYVLPTRCASIALGIVDDVKILN